MIALIAGWLTGLLLAAWVSAPWAAWLGVAVVAAGCWFGLRVRAPRVSAAALALAACASAGLRASLASPTLDAAHISRSIGQSVTVHGWLAAEPEPRDDGWRLRVWAASVQPLTTSAPAPAHGWLLVAVPRSSPTRAEALGDGRWQYGDSVVITATLEAPPTFAGFDYRGWLARQGVFAQAARPTVAWQSQGHGWAPLTAVYAFKRHALDLLAQLLPEPHAALLQGILLGDDHGLPVALRQAFQTTGATHILAISGFNIAILAGVLMNLFGRLLSPWQAAGVTALCLAGYAVLAGAGASVVRAAIMGVTALAAQQIGRGSGGVRALALACLAMTAVDPNAVWDVGFQLSAAATLGLIIYAGPISAAGTRALERITGSSDRAQRLAAWLADGVFNSWAAQLTTLPLIVFYFNQVSLAAFPVNALVLPAQPAVMVLGLLALSLALIWAPLGHLVAWLVWPFTAYTVGLIELGAQLPLAAVPVDGFGLPALIAYYAGLAALTVWLRQPAEQRPLTWLSSANHGLQAGGLLCLAALALWAWTTTVRLPEPGRLTITVLDVGAGQASLIETATGARILVDSGPPGAGLVRALDRVLPPFDRRIEALVLTRDAPETLGGVADLLARYTVGQIWYLPDALTSRDWRDGLDAVLTAQVPLTPLPVAGRLRVNEEVVLAAYPGQHLALERDGFRVVWGAAAPLPATVWISDSPALDLGGLQQANPQLLVAATRASLSAPAAAHLLAGRAVLARDERGTVVIDTDGDRLWAWAER